MTIVLSAVVGLRFELEVFAAGSSPPASQVVAPLPPNPALDAKVKTYLQKRFNLPDPKQIDLGPVLPTPMPGVFARSLKISNEKGQSITALMYTNANEDQAILGQSQMYDMTKDPWEPFDLSKLHLEDRPVMGNPNAPVTIIEFADFECPFCAHAFSILETMVHNTYKDKVKVIYKNYPLNVHPWAVRAALGAECGRLQNPDAFWDFARDYYTNQGSITVKNIDDHTHATAKRLGLDIPTLDACMAGKAAPARVDQDQKDGPLVGVGSTPTLFVNGVQIVGLPEEKAFEWIVNSQVEAAGKPKEMLRK